MTVYMRYELEWSLKEGMGCISISHLSQRKGILDSPTQLWSFHVMAFPIIEVTNHPSKFWNESNFHFQNIIRNDQKYAEIMWRTRYWSKHLSSFPSLGAFHPNTGMVTEPLRWGRRDLLSLGIWSWARIPRDIGSSRNGRKIHFVEKGCASQWVTRTWSHEQPSHELNSASSSLLRWKWNRVELSLRTSLLLQCSWSVGVVIHQGLDGQVRRWGVGKWWVETVLL